MDTDEKKKFHAKMKNAKIVEKVEKVIQEDGSHCSACRKYIMFNGKETDFEELETYFKTIENRLRLAKYCLYKISEECTITEKSEEQAKDLLGLFEKGNTVDADFVVRCEYFLFAIKTCLDVMGHILKKIYELNIDKDYLNISKVKEELKRNDDRFAKELLSAWNAWIKDLVVIRNKMTHHMIVEMRTQMSHNIPEKKVTYCKHTISFKDDAGTEITKRLPTYFEELIKNFDNLLDEFYKRLDSVSIQQR